MVLFTPLQSPVIFEELCSDVFAGTCGGVEAAGSSQKVSERLSSKPMHCISLISLDIIAVYKMLFI